MTISRVGFASAQATTITIPAHQVGDLIIIWAFRDGSVTNPTIGLSGGTTITNASDGTSCSISAAWKRALSTGETSGTWTNATGLVCAVYRGVATNKTPLGSHQSTSGTTNTVTYASIINCKTSSWIVGFAAHRSINTTIESPPSGFSMQTNTVGALAEFVGFDTNGPRGGTGSYPTTTVAITGTASGWMSTLIEIYNEDNKFNNYMGVRAAASNTGILSAGGIG